jgi:ribonuclease P protein component
MIPRLSRLPYREFHSRGYRTANAPFFVLKMKKNGGRINKIGIVISTAVIKSAARRNFWKRQVKTIFKLLPDAGADFLIIFSKKIKDCTVKEFKETFSRTAQNLIE